MQGVSRGGWKELHREGEFDRILWQIGKESPDPPGSLKSGGLHEVRARELSGEASHFKPKKGRGDCRGRKS